MVVPDSRASRRPGRAGQPPAGPRHRPDGSQVDPGAEVGQGGGHGLGVVASGGAVQAAGAVGQGGAEQGPVGDALAGRGGQAQATGPAGTSSSAAGRAGAASATPGGGGGVDPGGVGVLVGGDRGPVRQQVAELVGAVQQHLAGERVDREADRPPPGRVTVSASRSTVTSASGSASTAAASSAWTSAGSSTGSSPFLRALLRKMSANSGASTALMPKPWSAQAACSRDDPDPKLAPASRTAAGHLRPVEDDPSRGRPSPS